MGRNRRRQGCAHVGHHSSGGHAELLGAVVSGSEELQPFQARGRRVDGGRDPLGVEKIRKEERIGLRDGLDDRGLPVNDIEPVAQEGLKFRNEIGFGQGGERGQRALWMAGGGEDDLRCVIGPPWPMGKPVRVEQRWYNPLSGG